MQVKDHILFGDTGPVAQLSTPNGDGPMAAAPTTLVLHATGGALLAHTLYRFCDAGAEASAHLIIDRDGSITQMMPLNHIAWHAGTSRWTKGPGVNAYSIGIELVNAGRLMRDGKGGCVTQTGDVIPPEEVVEAAHPHTPGSWTVGTPIPRRSWMPPPWFVPLLAGPMAWAQRLWSGMRT